MQKHVHLLSLHIFFAVKSYYWLNNLKTSRVNKIIFQSNKTLQTKITLLRIFYSSSQRSKDENLFLPSSHMVEEKDRDSLYLQKIY
jgi:hypothetical protein